MRGTHETVPRGAGGIGLLERDFLSHGLPDAIDTPELSRFAAAEHFVAGLSGQQAEIRFLTDAFRQFYLPLVEDFDVPAAHLAVHEVSRAAKDSDIVAGLGGKEQAELRSGSTTRLSRSSRRPRAGRSRWTNKPRSPTSAASTGSCVRSTAAGSRAGTSPPSHSIVRTRS